MSQNQLDYASIQTEAALLKRIRNWFGPHPKVLIGIVGFLGVVAWAGWRFFGLHVDNPTGYSSPATVLGYTGFPPPPSAIHIRTAGFSEGMAFSHFVRFEAPVADSIAYAQKIAHGKPLAVDDPGGRYQSFVFDEQKYIPNLTAWFDLPSAKNVVGAEPGPQVWVDQSRGVFYFYLGF
jgi:hypothetical protein